MKLSNVLMKNTNMSQDEFTKLFSYMAERFDRLEEKIYKKADAKNLQKVLVKIDVLSEKT